VTAPVRVYKLGGPALEQPELIAPLAGEIRACADRVLLVHGGGRAVERELAARAIESRFVSGRRATSPDAMTVVELVLSGVVNRALVEGLVREGVPAVGVSGRDGGLIVARPSPGLERAGQPERVQLAMLETLWAAGLVPVVSPVSEDAEGRPVNVNADEAALALAGAVRARSLVYLSDVDGVRAGGRSVEVLEEAQAEAHIAAGEIAGGMALKVRMALEAARSGIAEVVIAGVARLRGSFPGTRVSVPTAQEALP
jgi:acetylglutamate kinase